MTEFTNDFSKEIYEQTYKYGDENINDTMLRISKDLSSCEEKPDYWCGEFMKALENFKFVPGGRIISNAGLNLKGTTYINCYVSGFAGEDQDSMEGIMEALKKQALILKSEGGYGFCSDVMRPRGSFVHGIANDSPGSVKMLEMWDTQSDVITAGSGQKNNRKDSKKKIRKGAQMVTKSCLHPDIEEFITAKQTPGRLTKFNMSVLITDEFMDAVKNHKQWNLIFPDYDAHKEEYKKYWDGDFKAWEKRGLTFKVYKTYEDANELWDLIMQSTYSRNEPGVLFIDTVNRMNNLQYCENISASNPCGEQLLPVNGSCLLGSLNLTQFINDKRTDWNYDELKRIIPICIRLMDNVNDKTIVPLEEQKQQLKDKRRIGLGIMGYGSALLMMKVKYGSKKALDLTKKLMEFIANTAYQSSSLLANEKGSFPAFVQEKYLESNFLKILSPETIEMIKKYGIRNSHLLSIQPTGNSSIFSNCVSGGLEPVFSFQYKRTSILPYFPEGLNKPSNINWESKTMVDKNNVWSWIKEGDDNLLRTEFNGVIYKIDKNRGLLKETDVIDYGVKVLMEHNEWDQNAEWASCTFNMNIDQHIDTMNVLSRYIDSAMSKTLNIPKNYPYEEFKEIYTKLHKTGTIKGGTTYREGTMSAVLSVAGNPIKSVEQMIQETTAPKRPIKLECDILRFQNNKEKWIGFVGLLKGKPYEVFTGLLDAFQVPTFVEKGWIKKVKEKTIDKETGEEVEKSRYDLVYIDKDGYEQEMRGLSRAFNSEYWNYGKFISGVLRHGMPLPSLVNLVDSLSLGGDHIVTWKAGVKRMLKKYIQTDGEGMELSICPSCGQKTVYRQENCEKCLSCTYSKCDG